MDGEYWIDIPVECVDCNELFHPQDNTDLRRVMCYDCLPAAFIKGERYVPAVPQVN